jgi:hypothetical protein
VEQDQASERPSSKALKADARDRVIVELKVVLRATGKPLCLLINFGRPKVKTTALPPNPDHETDPLHPLHPLHPP